MEKLTALLLCAVGMSACGYGNMDIGPPHTGGSHDGGTPAPGPGAPPDSDGGVSMPPPGATIALERPSRSSTIAITDDGLLVVMVNPDDGSISIFKTADNNRVATVATGGEPASVVLAPDNATAYVANRADATVVKVSGIDTLTPSVSATVAVGSEPVGLALSPTGAKLFVAQFAQGGVAQIDTASMKVTGTIAAPQHPRALLVTNNGDLSDDDEFLLVPEFFGVPVAGKEAQDDGRTGLIRIYHVSTLAKDTPITLAPIDSGFQNPGATATVLTSPNQLASISVVDSRVFVTSVSASAAGPPKFDSNVFPVVYVADLTARTEIRTALGTTNLARKIDDANTTPSATNPRFALGDLWDMSFVPGKNIAYAVSRAGDAIQRVVWDPAAGVKVGSTQNLQIDVLGDPTTTGQCQAPIGNVANEDATRLYVNCWVSRKLAVVDLASQTLQATFDASTQPQTADDKSAQRGKRFFFTGRGRWSSAGTNGAKGGEGWSSCGSCHPDGQSDNITWSFTTGPRQTISMVGSFSHGPGTQKRRIFNYTGINDEMHDFEANTRNVSGGLGAITAPINAADTSTCASGSTVGETPVALNPTAGVPGIGSPMKALADGSGCAHKDWDDIDNFVSKLRPPRAIVADPAIVARGKVLFDQGGCAKCHGGAGWTVSRRFYTPGFNADAANPTLPPESLAKIAFSSSVFPSTWSYDTLQVEAQPIITPVGQDTTGPGEAAIIAPTWIACVLRNVGTFGDGDMTAPDSVAANTLALEVNQKGTRAQGRGGFNVPSLYGLALSGPYLHHGQAPTLEALFTDPRWGFHTASGFANFLPGAAPTDPDVQALKTYLLSIDAAQAEFTVPTQGATSYDACPAGP